MADKIKGPRGHNFSELLRLADILRAIGNEDSMAVENKHFAKFGYHSEKEKIEAEANYVKSKLEANAEDYKKSIPSYDSNLSLINLILASIDDFKLKDIPRIKQYLIRIELKADLSIGLFSEVKNVYESKLSEMHETVNNYDYVMDLNGTQIINEIYDNNKNNNGIYNYNEKNDDNDIKKTKGL